MSSSSPPDAGEHRRRDEPHASLGRAGRLVASWRKTYLSPRGRSLNRCAGLRAR
jgi:hypothetical protein